MSNLKLVTTENFGNISCDFYRNMNDDILLTREQIGSALEYRDPSTAITKIHLRHKDRLDQFSVYTKLVGTDGKRIQQVLIQSKRCNGDMSLEHEKESQSIHGLVLGCNRKISK